MSKINFFYVTSINFDYLILDYLLNLDILILKFSIYSFLYEWCHFGFLKWISILVNIKLLNEFCTSNINNCVTMVSAPED